MRFKPLTPEIDSCLNLKGWNRDWCTAAESTIEEQLIEGDLYVYYSKDQTGKAKIPRLAIRINGDSIAEVRGIGPNQNIDEKIEGFGYGADPRVA